MKIKYGEKSPQNVFKPSDRLLSSKLKNAVLITGLLTTLGFVGAKAGESQVVNANAQTIEAKNTVASAMVEKKEFKRVDVKWLRALWNKNIKEEGLLTALLDYDGTERSAFSILISIPYKEDMDMPLVLGNETIFIFSGVLMPASDNTVRASDNPEEEYIKKSLDVLVTKKGAGLFRWNVVFDKLEKEYKAMTGKELRYVIAVVDHSFNNEDGEFVDWYIIPADSFEDVKNGNIKENMPVHIITYIAKTNELWSNDDTPEKYRTAYLEKDGTAAEK